MVVTKGIDFFDPKNNIFQMQDERDWVFIGVDVSDKTTNTKTFGVTAVAPGFQSAALSATKNFTYKYYFHNDIRLIS